MSDSESPLKITADDFLSSIDARKAFYVGLTTGSSIEITNIQDAMRGRDGSIAEAIYETIKNDEYKPKGE